MVYIEQINGDLAQNTDGRVDVEGEFVDAAVLELVHARVDVDQIGVAEFAVQLEGDARVGAAPHVLARLEDDGPALAAATARSELIFYEN